MQWLKGEQVHCSGIVPGAGDEIIQSVGLWCYPKRAVSTAFQAPLSGSRADWDRSDSFESPFFWRCSGDDEHSSPGGGSEENTWFCRVAQGLISSCLHAPDIKTPRWGAKYQLHGSATWLQWATTNIANSNCKWRLLVTLTAKTSCQTRTGRCLVMGKKALTRTKKKGLNDCRRRSGTGWWPWGAFGWHEQRNWNPLGARL